MNPIILGILANALYELIKGEGSLMKIAKYIDKNVLSKSKLLNRQTLAKQLQDSRNAKFLEELENYQQTKNEQMLVSVGEEFSKIIKLPENQILQQCVNQIITNLEQEDNKLLATLITASASQHQIELSQIRNRLDEIKTQLKTVIDNSAKVELDDISRLTEELSSFVFTLRDSIGCYQRSVKDKVAKIIELLRSGENLVLVLGEAGSGKSAMLKRLYIKLSDSNLRLNGTKPSKVVYLDVGSYMANSPKALREKLGLKLDLLQLLRTIASTSSLVLILDGLDETLGYEDATQVWNNIILETITIQNAQVVVSCREYDWANTKELEPLRKKQKPKKILLRQWGIDSVRKALIKNNLSYPDEDVLEFLRNPFLLDLYVEIADELSGIENGSFQTEADLYNRYWNLRVSAERPPVKKEHMIRAVHWLAEQAEKEQTQRFDRDAFFIEHSYGAEGLERNSVILSNRRGVVYFRHSLLLDYAIIRHKKWLSNPDKPANLLREIPYNPFLRSSVFMVVRFLIADDDWKIVQSLLSAATENCSVGWIINLLDLLARSGWSMEMSKCLKGILGGLSKDRRQTYLVFLVGCLTLNQPEWCELFLELPEDWISEEEGTSLHKAVSEFMESLVDSKPSTQTQELLIRAGQRLERIAHNTQTKNQKEKKEWTDWPSMRYINILGKTKNPELINWLLEVASLSWTRVKIACMDQVPWVSDVDPSAGAKLMALSLTFPEDIPEEW